MRAWIVWVVLVAAAPAAASDPVREAIEQTFEKDSRAAGIAALRRLSDSVDDPRPLLRALARALSWEGRLDEALEVYRRLIPKTDPDQRRELEHERLQILLWQGQLEEAERGYRRLVDSDRGDARARAGLGKIRRWRGEPLAAREQLERARSLAPDDSAVRAELAGAYLDLGMPYTAAAILGDDASGEVADRAARHRHPTVALSSTGSSDSFGVERLAPRATGKIPLPLDLELAVGAGLSVYQQDAAALQYRIAAGGLTVRRPRWRLGVEGAVYQGDDLLLAEGRAQLRATIADGVVMDVSGGRRPLLEPARPLDTGQTSFFAAGGAGVTDLAAVSRRGVDELRAGLQLSGGAGYLYGDARTMRVTDGNQGFAIAGGAALSLLGAGGPVGFDLRIDSYVTGFAEASATYFSPQLFDGHVAGAQLRLSGLGLTVAGGGGVNLSLDQGSAGWTAGGGVRAGGENWHIAARAERRDQIAYQVSRAWLEISVRP